LEALQKGDRVILGASTKGGDWKRWSGARKYVAPDLELIDPEKTAVNTDTKHSAEYMNLLDGVPWRSEMPSVKDPKKDEWDFHAGDMRFLLAKAGEDDLARRLLGDFVGDAKVYDLLKIFGLSGINGAAPGLEETSTMAGGAVAGAVGANGGPWAGVDMGKENEQEKARSKLIRRENIDLSTVDQVIQLIMEKGIMQ